MRVVLDTNVLISSTLWEGSVAQKLLVGLIKQDAEMFSSVEILSEYQKVLRRDFDYSDEDVAHITGVILSFIRLVKPDRRIEAVSEDPQDNKIIECAMASGSSCIVTYDEHLLKLGSFEGISIVRPEEFMKERGLW